MHTVVYIQSRDHGYLWCWILALAINVPSNFLKSLCAQHFLCTTFYQHSSIFRMPCLKYVQTHLLKGDLCALKVFLSALISRPVCTHTHAQLRGNIAGHGFELYCWGHCLMSE